MQSSYEVVRRAIHFERPDRLPLEFDSLGISDTASIGWNQIGTGDKAQRRTTDEWGCVWERSEQTNMGQVKGHPLAEWDALDRFAWPDPDDPARYERMEERLEGTDGLYRKTSIFMLLFERLHALRGFENTLTDLYLEPERIEALADRIVEYDVRTIEQIASRFPSEIHGFTFTDDWGTELSGIISTALWDEFFRPRYARIFDAAHAAGWDVWMHSCGRVNQYIPSLIEIGCDVLNLQQPRTTGIEEIGSAFAGRVAFSSLCDIQHTLPFASDAAIDAEARELLERWATDEGGFILSDYGDGRAIGVEDRTKRVMLDAFRRHDRWKEAVCR